MIQLHSDCLVFKMSTGETIPCSAELVTIELIGQAVDALDPYLIRQAAASVLHYFKHELGRSHVTLGEFSTALETALRGLGLDVKSAEDPPASLPPTGSASLAVEESDLRLLACESLKGFELAFFPRLRDELSERMDRAPRVMRFKGLRGCVKQLVGARRWTGRCQQLNDQIVEFIRHYWSLHHPDRCLTLIVQ